jgi:hypothetical protein
LGYSFWVIAIEELTWPDLLGHPVPVARLESCLINFQDA